MLLYYTLSIFAKYFASSVSPPSIRLSPRGSVSVKEGSLLTISCQVTGDVDPPPSLSLQKISSSGSSQVILTNSSSLEINMTSVRIEDEGTYVCHAGQLEERLRVSFDDRGDFNWIISILDVEFQFLFQFFTFPISSNHDIWRPN